MDEPRKADNKERLNRLEKAVDFLFSKLTKNNNLFSPDDMEKFNKIRAGEDGVDNG